MQPIDQKTYLAKVMTPHPENVCTPTETGELSDAEFLMTVQDILQEGFERGQDIDYVTDRVFDLVKNNPKLAEQNHLPTDRPTIKTKIVDAYFKEKTTEFDLSKTADCLMESTQQMQELAVACGASMAPIPVVPIPARIVVGAITCGILATKVAACIQDGTEEVK